MQAKSVEEGRGHGCVKGGEAPVSAKGSHPQNARPPRRSPALMRTVKR